MTVPDPVVIDRPRPVSPEASAAADARRPAAAPGAAARPVLATVRRLEQAWPLYVVAILLVLILV